MENQHSFILRALILVGALVVSNATFSAETASSSSASFVPAQAACVIGSPVDKTQLIVTQVLDVLRKDQNAIKNNFAKVEDDISAILASSIDINKIADYVVPATLMQQATPEQRDAVRSVLLKFFISSYSTAFKSFNENVSVTVYPMRAGVELKDTVQVNTAVLTDASGNPNSIIPVALVMTRDSHVCQWNYVDFVVDNISAVSNVQSQIQAIKAKNLVELTEIIQKHNDAVAKGE